MRWLREDEHEVVVAVFQSTDFAQHRLWKYLDQPGHPLREALLEMYRAIDQMVGEARALLGDGAAVAVVSDHGFGPHPTTLRAHRCGAPAGRAAGRPAAGVGGGEGITRALRRAPALRRVLRKAVGRLPGAARDRLAARATGTSRCRWEQTSAYRIPLYPPAEGVVVNLRGRQARGFGRRPATQYERVRDRIIETFAAAARSRHRRAGGAVGKAPRAALLGRPPRGGARRGGAVRSALQGRLRPGRGVRAGARPDPRQLLGRARDGGRVRDRGRRRPPRRRPRARARSSTSHPRCWLCSGCRCPPTPTAR